MIGIIKSLADRTWEKNGELRTYSLVDIEGEEVKVWGEPIEFEGRIPGDEVHLLKIDNYYRIVNPANEPLPVPTLERPEVADRIVEYANLYSDCYRAAVAAMPEGAPPEIIQSCTSSVFISVTRKMGI